LEAAVVPVTRAVCFGSAAAAAPRVDKDADGHRHFAAMNEVVEHHWHAHLAVRADVIAAILKDHQRGGFRAVVLCRDVDPTVSRRARENGGVSEGELLDSTLWNARLRLGVRS